MSRRVYWVKRRLKYLRMWRETAKAIARAVKDLDPLAEVYVVGGAAEDRLTVLSDIDTVVVPSRPLDSKAVDQLRREAYARATDSYNLPWDYPVEVHIMQREEFEEVLLRRGKGVIKVGN